MAHVGQEIRLHARRLFSHLLGAAQLLLHLLQFCNHAAGERVEAILRLLDQLTVRVRPCQLLLEETDLPLEALAALRGAGIRGIGHGVSVGEDQRNEALVVVLRAGAVAHVGTDFTVAVKPADHHGVTESATDQVQLFHCARAEEELSCRA